MSKNSQNSADHTIQTPSLNAGAISIIRVRHPDPESIGLPRVNLHQLKLCSFFGIDEGVITRWDNESVVLMAHGGKAITKLISQELTNRGVPHRSGVESSFDVTSSADLCSMGDYSESSNKIDSLMHSILARAMSPLAVDLLLDQPERWESIGVGSLQHALNIDSKELADHRALSRLIDPPIIAAIGKPNIGKSTLLNTLVGEQVAIVADIEGTTRDHVGVLVDLGGLVVRWVDTPGVDKHVSAFDEQAIEIAQRVLEQAHLIVHCIDSFDPDGTLDPRLGSSIDQQAHRVRLGVRSDRGDHRTPIDLRVSMNPENGQSRGSQDQSTGIPELVEHIREILIPVQTINDPRPWRFWE